MQFGPQSTARVLIVDDDTILASLYRIKLQNAGFLVEIAESGEGGLLKISQSAPDIVVLDLMLGDMNGVEVLEMLRANPPTRSLPVVVFSSAFLGGLVDEAIKAGATKVLNKANCPPNRLIEELQGILAHQASGGATSLDMATGTATPPPQLLEPRMVAPPRPTIAVSPQGSTPAPAPPPAASRPQPPPTGRGPDDELHGDMRRELLGEVRKRIDDAIRPIGSWMKNPQNVEAPYLGAMYRAVRSIAGSASLAGRLRLGHVAGGLEALLREIKRTPSIISRSTPLAVEQAIQMLPKLAQGDELATEVLPSPRIVIVDDDPGSRRAIASALENAQLAAINVGDAGVAIQLFGWNRWDLAIVDMDMHGADGIELASWLADSPLNARTPVIAVSDGTNLETRMGAASSRPTDIMLRPISPLELGVRALHAVYGLRD